MMAYIQQSTLQYVTFLKRAAVEALQDAFVGHPDPTVAIAKVAIDYTTTDFRLPAVIIKYYETKNDMAGVGHIEWLPYPITADPLDPTTVFIEYQHRMYDGIIEFEIFGMSSADRDVIRDALVETLGTGDVSPSGLSFQARFYAALTTTPYGLWHFPTLNIDNLTNQGEQTMPPPWNPEDPLVYQTAERVPVFGEFYSNTPTAATGTNRISEVDVYEWPVDQNGNPIDPTSPPPPVSSGLYDDFIGWPSYYGAPDSFGGGPYG